MMVAAMAEQAAGQTRNPIGPDGIEILVLQPYMRIISACGEIVTEDKGLVALLGEMGKQPPLICRLGPDSGDFFVRLMGGGGKKKTHLHLDVASPAYFTRGGVPRSNASMEQIVKAVTPFFGQKYTVTSECECVTPAESVPANSIIRKGAVDIKADNFTIRQTGGKFALGGLPVDSIAWEVVGDVIKTSLELTVTEQFTRQLFKRFQLIHQVAYNALVLVRNPDETAPSERGRPAADVG